MKTFILCLFSVLTLLSAFGADKETAKFDSQTFACPTTVAAGVTTNLTGAPVVLDGLFPKGDCTARLSASFLCSAAATNNTVTVVFSTSTDGVKYDTAAQSYIKLTATPVGGTTVTVSGRVNLVGVKGIKVSQVADLSAGDISALEVRINTPQP